MAQRQFRGVVDYAHFETDSGIFLRFALSGFLQFFNNLKNSVSTHHRIIHQEFESGGIFQNDRAGDETLNPFTVADEQVETPFLLVWGAQDADEYEG